jgi:hypothetical protein
VRVHVISVGKSLFDFFARPHSGDRDLADRVRRARITKIPTVQVQNARAAEAHAWLTRCLVDRDDATRDELAKACDIADPGRWPARVSAELSTVAAVPAGSIPLPAVDSAVLIPSDTFVGLRAALWNAVALAGGDLDRVRYTPDLDPDRPLGEIAGHVLITRIPGMHAGTDKGFRAAMRHLGLLGRLLVDTAKPGRRIDFDFHLSGGYKAAIPYLIGLAEGLRSLPGGHHVEAYVLHEATEGNAIRLPLRRVTVESVDEELARGWDRQGRRSRPPHGGVLFLEGYAYQESEDRDGWVLTPFGHGLRALFGKGEEGVSPG